MLCYFNAFVAAYNKRLCGGGFTTFLIVAAS